MRDLIISAIILRAILLIYGIYQDSDPVLKYTDVDYQVFTDSASFVQRGLSPYLRSTYRYTPLLAILMVPNSLLIMWGKLLFIAGDIFTGIMIYKLLLLRIVKDNDRRKLESQSWYITGFVWMWNPFVAV